jgi:hypothetical protein
VSSFSDQLLLKFLEDNFVQDLLTNQLGLASLFNATYSVDTIDLRELALAGVQRKQFEVPAFETIRTNGIDEQIIPTAGRVRIDRSQPRYGRLAWVDVFLDVLLATKVESKAMPIESITATNLLEKLGGVNSMAELRSKLAALYPPSVVDAFFKQIPMRSIEDFKRQPTLFLEFIFKQPAPFDPNDSQNARDFRLNVCIQFQAELKVSEALQAAKLCRSILENEHDSMTNFTGARGLEQRSRAGHFQSANSRRIAQSPRITKYPRCDRDRRPLTRQRFGNFGECSATRPCGHWRRPAPANDLRPSPGRTWLRNAAAARSSSLNQ